MPEYKVILTWEAIYDVTDIADYIEADFGEEQADKFQVAIREEMSKLEYMGNMFLKHRFSTEGTPYIKAFSTVYYLLCVMEEEVHILRVLREEQNWERILAEKEEYTYPDMSH